MSLRSVCFALVFVLAGCEFQHPVTDAGTPDPREAAATATIDGFTQDMEYHFLSFMNCANEMCPPPLLIAGFPNVEGGKVHNAQVTAIDPGGAVAGTFEGLTGYDGLYSIRDVAMGEHEVVYLNATVDGSAPPPEGEPFPRAWTPELEWLPTDFNYVSTTTARPIYTANQSCFNTRAAVISDIGILQAVAKRMSVEGGTTVTVANLLDPTLYGGVVVNWNLFPDEVYVWVPFFESTATFDVGTAFAVTWSAPGDFDPSVQSDLGFVVVPEDDPSILVGLNVAVLPATTAASTSVTITGVDPITNPDEGRPIPFEPLVIQARPGEVTYVDAMPFPTTVFGEELGPEFCATP